jgi:hypothetical protein
LYEHLSSVRAFKRITAHRNPSFHAKRTLSSNTEVKHCVKFIWAVQTCGSVYSRYT